MIIKRIDFNDFIEEFKRCGREDQFSYEAKKALFEYLNELSEDLNEAIELDIIGICCDYSEYKNLKEFLDDYGYSIDDIDSIDNINYYTTVIKIDDKAFIIQNF